MTRKSTPQAPLAKLKKAAVEAAHASGAILLRNFGRKISVSEKLNAGLVTNVDVAAERASMKILRKAFPEMGFLAEESAPIASSAGTRGRWIIDPLDGTTNYVHGFPMFCVSIAAEWEGELAVGVIYHPILKDTYVAVRGKGATINGRKLRVSQCGDLRKTLLTTGFTYGKDENLMIEMEAFARMSEVARAVRRPGSAALDLAYTARGVFDGFWERRLSPWDVAAGALLVTEAGGKVTDFQGRPFRVEMKEILACNPRIHAQLLDSIAGRSKGI